MGDTINIICASNLLVLHFPNFRCAIASLEEPIHSSNGLRHLCFSFWPFWFGYSTLNFIEAVHCATMWSLIKRKTDGLILIRSYIYGCSVFSVTTGDSPDDPEVMFVTHSVSNR